ncbi:MAG: hypothetical protein LC754_16085 [Acidobacteria bacterium]|nr:hypothetical protein [Acidobacteriota bacterium]
MLKHTGTNASAVVWLSSAPYQGAANPGVLCPSSFSFDPIGGGLTQQDAGRLEGIVLLDRRHTQN